MLKPNEVQRIVRIRFYYKNEAEITTIDIFEKDLNEGQTLEWLVNDTLKTNITYGWHVYRITVKLEAKKIKKGWFRK